MCFTVKWIHNRPPTVEEVGGRSEEVWITDRGGKVRAEVVADTIFYWGNGRTIAWAIMQKPEPFQKKS